MFLYYYFILPILDPRRGTMNKERITKELDKMMETVLNYSQVACSNPYVYKNLRSKTLRACNDCKRNILEMLEEDG